MSKGYGKAQQTIINTLENGGYDDYWMSMSELVEFTGLLRPSLQRGIKRLVEDGIVTHKWTVTDSWNGGLNKRSALYILTSKVAEQEAINADKAAKLVAERGDMTDSEWEEYRIKKLFGRV